VREMIQQAISLNDFSAGPPPPPPPPSKRKKVGFHAPMVTSRTGPSPLELMSGIDPYELWLQEDEARIAKLEARLEAAAGGGSSLHRSRRVSHETYSKRPEPVHHGGSCRRLPLSSVQEGPGSSSSSDAGDTPARPQGLPPGICLMSAGNTLGQSAPQRLSISGGSPQEDYGGNPSPVASASSNPLGSTHHASTPCLQHGASFSSAASTPQPYQPFRPRSASMYTPHTAGGPGVGRNHSDPVHEPIGGPGVARSYTAPAEESQRAVRPSNRNPHGLTMSQRVAALQVGFRNSLAEPSQLS